MTTQPDDNPQLAPKNLERTAYELTENIPVGTYTMVQPAEGGMARFAFMSTRFLQLTGLKREEAAADPLKGFACVHPDDFDAWVALNVEAFTHKQRFYGTTRVVVDGEVRWITAESLPRTMADGSTIWEGALTDITEQKRIEQDLERARAEAERANEAKTQFLASVSHEIRTPMNAVIGLSQLLEREPLSAKQMDYVRRIGDASNLLLSIINDVLDLSKIEAGKVSLVSRPFNLETTLKKVVNLYLPLVEGKPVAISIEITPDTPLNLIGDALRLEQILGNLLSNAIKFTAQGTVSLSASLSGHRGGRAWIRLTVSDTGTGIRADLLGKLFEPFMQAHDDQSQNMGGTGLGLSICKRLTDLMEGEITVCTEQGQGSQFNVELPFAIADGIEAPPTQPAQPVAGSTAAVSWRPHVLIVDDVALNCEVLSDFIRLLGGTSDTATDGLQALERLRVRPCPYDAVLMDIHMPHMDGLAATRLIRANPDLHTLPVIAFTAAALESQIESAITAGMNAVLTKPVRIEKLAACLQKHLKQAFVPPAATLSALAQHPNPAHTIQVRHRQLFVEHYADVQTRLQQHLKANELEAARRLLHNLRGAAAHIGADPLAEAAKQIEHMLSNGHAPSGQQQSALNKAIQAALQEAQQPPG